MPITPKQKNARRNADRKRLAGLALMLACFLLLCAGIVLLVKAAASRHGKPAVPEGQSAQTLPEIGVELPDSLRKSAAGLPVIGVPDVKNAAQPAETPSETRESTAAETKEETAAPETTAPEPSTEKAQTTAPETTKEVQTTAEETTAAPTAPPTQPPPPSTTAAPTAPPPTTTAAPTQPPPQTTSGETVTPPVNTNGLRVWVGDSRTRGLKLYAGADAAKDSFICEDGTGLDWFEKTAVPQLEALIAEKTVSAVYINMGINDCAATYKTAEDNRSAAYSRDINVLVSRYPQIRFYFLSIGPGDGETYFSTDIPKMNAEADAFNAGMKTRCLAGYIPVAEHLKSSGFTTMDGLHYDAATCKKIYAYVLQMSEP